MSHDLLDVSTRSRYHYTFYMPNLGMQLFMIIFLSAQAPQPAPNLPDAQATLQYLRDTIDWYHGLHIEEQLATDPTDAMFLEDNRQLAKQIVRLSFDFARGQAKLLSNRAAPGPEETQSSEPARYSGLLKAATQADQEVKET